MNRWHVINVSNNILDFLWARINVFNHKSFTYGAHNERFRQRFFPPLYNLFQSQTLTLSLWAHVVLIQVEIYLIILRIKNSYAHTVVKLRHTKTYIHVSIHSEEKNPPCTHRCTKRMSTVNKHHGPMVVAIERGRGELRGRVRAHIRTRSFNTRAKTHSY